MTWQKTASTFDENSQSEARPRRGLDFSGHRRGETIAEHGNLAGQPSPQCSVRRVARNATAALLIQPREVFSQAREEFSIVGARPAAR